MIIELKRDFIPLTEKNVVAYAIDSEFLLAGGIAKKMDELYDTRRKLHEEFDSGYTNVGYALYIEGMFHLVVKEKPSETVDPENLVSALEDMLEQCKARDINYVVMPWVCCGGEKLTKAIVEHAISYVFADSAVDIIIVSNDEPFIESEANAIEFAESIIRGDETDNDDDGCECEFGVSAKSDDEDDIDDDEEEIVDITVITNKPADRKIPDCPHGPCDTPPQPAKSRKYKYIPKCCRNCPCHGKKSDDEE